MDNHNILDEFKFRPDPTSDCVVSCPLVFEKSIFCIVATLVPSILIGSSSFLEEKKITTTSWMSLNLSQILPWTAELAALEKTLCPVTVLVDSQVSNHSPWATCYLSR